MSLDFYDTDGLADEDLAEMTVMALQDMAEPEEAASKVLELLLGNSASKGVRQQLVHEMQNERAWEDHGDMLHHTQIFVAAGILNRAFPSLYPTPDIAQVTLEIVANDSASGSLLAQPLTPAFVTRLLASGMDDHSTLRRLFAEQLAGPQFPEAASVIWHIAPEQAPTDGSHASQKITIYLPWHWAGSLKSLQHFEATAHFDGTKG